MSEMNNDQKPDTPESPATPETPDSSQAQAPPSPEPAAAETGTVGGVSKDDKTFALLAHLLGIVTSFIGPLVIYLVKKDQSPHVADQAKEALNFQITICIGYLIASVLSIILIGVLLFPVLWVCNLIFCIIGGLKANEGELYRYPFAIRLIK